VNAFVKDIITPLIAAIGGEDELRHLAFTINGSRFAYGDFLNAALTFVIVAAVMFFLVIKPVNVLLDALQTEPEVDSPTRRARSACRRSRGPRTRCAFCTSGGGAGAGVGGLARASAAAAQPDQRSHATAIATARAAARRGTARSAGEQRRAPAPPRARPGRAAARSRRARAHHSAVQSSPRSGRRAAPPPGSPRCSAAAAGASSPSA
jgi:large conductance mechanosensitive channel